MFHKGFVISEAKEQFPTMFKLYDKRIDSKTGEILLRGRLRDIKKEDYFMSLELDGDDGLIYGGYNDEGDWITFNITNSS